MMRSAAYNRFGVLMGTSSRASCPRWLSLRGDSLPMITLISSQGDFCATALGHRKTWYHRQAERQGWLKLNMVVGIIAHDMTSGGMGCAQKPAAMEHVADTQKTSGE